MLRKLFDPEAPPAEPGGGNPQSTTPAAPPPAATAVVNGKTESEVNLERQLEEERSGRKKDQTRLSELEDENLRLKKAQQEPSDGKTSDGWHVPGEEDW
jgi:hypothetical protein